MFGSAVTVNLSGTLDRARLNALRSALNLRPEGRLDDAWDEIQGERVDEVPGGRIQILLYRFDLPGPWEFHLNIEDDPSAEALRTAEEQVVAAAGAVGLTVAGVSRHR
jgi:hypothetical protein